MTQLSLGETLLGLSRRQKRLLAVLVDTILCVGAVWAALYLRLEEWVWPTSDHFLALALAPALAIPIFIRGGLYRAVFRYTGWAAMIAVVRASLVYAAIYATIFTFIGVDGIPRTVGIIQPGLLFLGVATSRAVAHYVFGGLLRRPAPEGSQANVLVYGAGVSGRQLAHAVAQSGEMRVVGFLDDDRSVQGATINGLPIYDPEHIRELVAALQVDDVLLALPSASRRRRQEVVANLVAQTPISVRTLPGLLDLAHGRFHVSELRPVDIEDLLGRDPVVPSPELISKNLIGKVVLVSGGGGSIGSELCRQILEWHPATLLIVESSEYALYSIHRELTEKAHTLKSDVVIVPLLGSVLDERRMKAIFDLWRPDTVYHAAAYKHVPLVEHNVLDGIENNAFGTLTLATTAAAAGVKYFVLISTDKAVRPTNVMGASKRLAELILQALAAGDSRMRLSMVRFGNVLGSSGSVVPLFRQQIASGGPVTVTHRDVTRYFMTIPEAAQLVIQAGAMAIGGEVFVLDMGEPIRVYDLAVNMIRLSGLSVQDEDHPDGDIKISVVGLRPGEKLSEELLIGENPMRTDHERIARARENFLSREILDPQLAQLRAAIDASDVLLAVELLRKIVPEYAPERGSADWLILQPGSAPSRNDLAPGAKPADLLADTPEGYESARRRAAPAE